MTNFLATLVGMHFRPPAKLLLAALPLGTELIVEREPDNAYDPNAVKVSVLSANIPESQHEELSITLPNMGKTLEEILEQESWHLGYIVAKNGPAEEIAKLIDDEGYVVAMATLSSQLSGVPAVDLHLELSEDAQQEDEIEEEFEADDSDEEAVA